MTNEEAKKMLEAKLECFKNETSGINHDCNMRLCDGCDLNYEQGNMGEQKEALEMAIKALEQQPKKKMGRWNRWYEIIRHDGYEEHLPHCKCSECEQEISIYSVGFINYCPNCGCQMREAKK